MKTSRAFKSLGFTLVEMLVSMAVLALIMLLLVSMVDTVSSVWRRTTGKISAFEGARAGFEAMTRKLSQATLNTYWDYEYPGGDTTRPPSAYVRQSELHMICGQAATLLPAAGNVTTHAVFFQAPLGYSDDPSPSAQDDALQTLLNFSGFFIQHADDAPERPAFLQGTLPVRTRYRLMEIWQPTENFRVYEPTRAELRNTPALRTAWFSKPLGGSPSPARPLAENVIALVLWPRRAASDSRPPISPDYGYNSRAYLEYSPTALEALPASNPVRLSRNQLPPVVQVTMVALDETSAARLETLPASERALLEPGALFTAFGGATNATGQEQYFQDELARLTGELLNKHRLNYRLLTTAVTLRQAKWSEE